MRAAVSLLASSRSGRTSRLGFDVAELLQVLVERDLARPVTPPPPALPVARLVDDDAVDPGAEGGLAAEAGERAEDPQEDLLRQVERFVPVAEQVQGQRVDHPLVDGDELGAGRLVARVAARDERGFVAVDLRPAIAPAFFTRPPEMGVCMKFSTVLESIRPHQRR